MRFNYNDLIAQIASRLPDNSSGIITAGVLRSLLTDFVESVRGAASYLTRSGAGLSCALTPTYQVIPNLMPNVNNSAADEVEGSTITQTVTVKIAGFYRVQFDATCEGASNDEVNAAILVDGAEYPFCVARAQMLGAGKPVGLSNTAEIHLAANQGIALGLKIESTTASIIVGPVGMGVQFIPSRTS